MDARVSKETSIENLEEVYENFLQKSLGELRDYLSLRGLSVTGKKREPVARALSEGPVNLVDLLVVEVAVTLLYSNRRLFLGDLVLECSKGVRKRVGNGLPLVGFLSKNYSIYECKNFFSFSFLFFFLSSSSFFFLL